MADVVEEMPDIVVAEVAAKAKENVDSVESVEKPVNNHGENPVEKPVEKAVENVVENVEVAATNNVADDENTRSVSAGNAEKSAAESQVESVAADAVSEVVPVAAAVEQGVESEQVEQAAQNVGLEQGEQKRQDGRVQMVNSNGVRLRMAARNTNEAPAAKPAASPKSGGFCMKYYVVKPGEELMNIALKNNISPEKLLAANNLSGGEPQAGTVLRIPG